MNRQRWHEDYYDKEREGMFMKKKWKELLSVSMIIVSLLTGCGASETKSIMTSDSAASVVNSTTRENYSGGVAYDNAEIAVAEEDMAMESGGKTTSQSQQTPSADDITLLEEKLVYHCNLDIETLDYPAAITSIKQTISKYGGVIQSESESDSGHDWYYADYRKTGGTMHNYLEVRIPSKDYENFLSELDGVGKIISKSTNVDNISQKYYDTTAQIEALQIQEKNLLTMLEKCETIEDMITVEQRLSEVQYELNTLQTNRRYMDMDVAYSYVNISVSEVMEYHQDSEPIRRNTFVDRLKNTILSTGKGFLYFLEALLFLVIYLAPYALIIALFCFVFFRKRIRNLLHQRKEKKNMQKPQTPSMPPFSVQPPFGQQPTVEPSSTQREVQDTAQDRPEDKDL
ncbi:MAG TPA: hypothetical protein DEB74_16760 [Lachnospiraceae bacterium]|nr:hypothetical protein [Lachnospiraceae bacterium]